MVKEIRKVSNFVSTILFPEAEKIEIENVLDRQIIIEDFEVLRGDYGEFPVILFTFEGEQDKHTTAGGSSVVLKKLLKLKEADAFPVKGKIVSVKGKKYTYYDLVD